MPMPAFVLLLMAPGELEEECFELDVASDDVAEAVAGAVAEVFAMEEVLEVALPAVRLK